MAQDNPKVVLEGIMLPNLQERLLQQAENVEEDGWCAAARLMRNAADVLDVILTEDKDVVVRLKDDPDSDMGRLLWYDHTFALVKYFGHDKPSVEYLSKLEFVKTDETT